MLRPTGAWRGDMGAKRLGVCARILDAAISEG